MRKYLFSMIGRQGWQSRRLGTRPGDSECLAGGQSSDANRRRHGRHRGHEHAGRRGPSGRVCWRNLLRESENCLRCSAGHGDQNESSVQLGLRDQVPQGPFPVPEERRRLRFLPWRQLRTVARGALPLQVPRANHVCAIPILPCVPTQLPPALARAACLPTYGARPRSPAATVIGPSQPGQVASTLSISTPAPDGEQFRAGRHDSTLMLVWEVGFRKRFPEVCSKCSQAVFGTPAKAACELRA